MKKIVAINASPRANWNTAQLVKEAVKGAESVGVEVEYIGWFNYGNTKLFWRCYCWL